MKSVTRAALAALAAAVLATFSPIWAAAAAQEQVQKPVLVAIPEVFPVTSQPGAPQPETRAIVVRLASADHDMILLPRAHATPEALAAALEVLKRFRSSVPNPQNDGVATLVSFPPFRGDQRSLMALGRVIGRLHAAPQSKIGRFKPAPLRELGPGQKIVITDPDLLS